MIRTLLLTASLCLLAPRAAAQAPSGQKANADAKAGAQTSKTASHSKTRRIKVVNGKTVLDEATVDGKPARPGRRLLPRDVDADVLLEGLIGEWLDDLEKDAGRDVTDLLRGEGLKGPQRQGHQKSSSSSTHRVVVVNGKTIVDETTTDGKPMRGRQPSRGGNYAERILKDAMKDIDFDAMRDIHLDAILKMNREMVRELECTLCKPRVGTGGDIFKDSHRVVVVNGETILDERGGDGSPLKAPLPRHDAERPSLLSPIKSGDRRVGTRLQIAKDGRRAVVPAPKAPAVPKAPAAREDRGRSRIQKRGAQAPAGDATRKDRARKGSPAPKRQAQKKGQRDA